ncbi:putative delta-9 desaturase, partial [Aureobasidium melanogenum]
MHNRSREKYTLNSWLHDTSSGDRTWIAAAEGLRQLDRNGHDWLATTPPLGRELSFMYAGSSREDPQSGNRRFKDHTGLTINGHLLGKPEVTRLSGQLTLASARDDAWQLAVECTESSRGVVSRLCIPIEWQDGEFWPSGRVGSPTVFASSIRPCHICPKLALVQKLEFASTVSFLSFQCSPPTPIPPLDTLLFEGDSRIHCTCSRDLCNMPSHQPAAGMMAVDPDYVKQGSPMASKDEPNRSKSYDPKKPHITDTPMTKANWYKHVNWLNVFLIVGIPMIGCVQAYWTPLYLKTAIWAVAYYFATGLGITAGYHRLWAHTSYQATLPLKIFLAAVGGGAVEGSIRWWARDHRAHHRYTDTEKDPYSVRKGLLYSHFGWMLMKQNPKRIGRTDISDLNDDPVVVWQHKNYLKVVFFMGLIFPTLVAGLGWGDYLGGFIYAGILRIFFVQQATFCVNSLAHWLGDQPFDDRNSPRDHVITAVVTLGEGYHNFHHEFPSDYRNAIEWHQYDPTKWSIWTWKQLGLAYDLKQFRSNEIEKGRVQQLQKKIDRKRAELDWGTPLESLPVMEWDDYVEQCKNGRQLISVAGIVHDLSESNFVNDHPGGKAMIRSGIGKDATAMFNGGVYFHSNAAHNLLSTMRVGVIRGGMEVEIWKKAQQENKDAFIAKDSNGQRVVRAGLQPTKVFEPSASAGAA